MFILIIADISPFFKEKALIINYGKPGLLHIKSLKKFSKQS